MALNGGMRMEYSHAVSFKIDCADQAEVDRLWNTLITNGGQAERCGWLKDRYGLSWQIVPTALPMLSALLPRTMLLADRGYDADWIRELARQQRAWANIPPKRNRKDPICFSPYLYRARNLIERILNKIKQCRRVATRYDKLAANYPAFVELASIRIWLRANESAPLAHF